MKILRIVLALAAVVAVGGVVAWLLAEATDVLKPFIAAALGFLASKFYESYRENRTRLHDTKRQLYADLLLQYRTVLLDKIADGIDTTIQPAGIRQMGEAAFDAILYASDEVVKRFGELRTTDPTEGAVVLVRFSKLLRAMRQDLGHTYTSLTDAQILAMFTNMGPADLDNIRRAGGTV